MADIEPTDADRDTLRDRLKDAIARAGTTARAVEESLDLSRGTISRLYNGRRLLDSELLNQIASELGVVPDPLVAGTAFEELLVREPVREPEHTVVVEPPVVDTAEAHPEEVEARVDDVVTNAGTVEEIFAEVNEAAHQTRRPPPEEPEEPGRRMRFRDVPVKAAVAIAGGLAVVGGTLVALMRRK